MTNKVTNYDSNSKIINPKDIVIKIPLIYELIKKYSKQE